MKFQKKLFLFVLLVFIMIIILNPSVSTKGAFNGVLLCGRIIIPSLFPFTVCVLFLMKIINIKNFVFINKITYKIFHQNLFMFFIMILSFVGGYPIGAKIINEAVKNKKISEKNGRIMINFCVNAGPGFIISSVGYSILKSKQIGYILLFSHLISSIIISIFLGFFLEKEETSLSDEKEFNLSNSFVNSVSDSASAMLSISAYVIFFSSIINYILYYSKFIKEIKFLCYLFEVTNAINLTRNIYVISFLLGFSCFSIWCQVFSVAKDIKINYKLFIFSRIFHGALSTLITFILLKTFRISEYTISNNIQSQINISYSTKELSISLVIMSIIFIIALYTKNYTGKLTKDLV